MLNTPIQTEVDIVGIKFESLHIDLNAATLPITPPFPTI